MPRHPPSLSLTVSDRVGFQCEQQTGLDATQLPNVLNQSTTQLQKETPGLPGLGGMLDTNRDGQIADDVARIGKSILGSLFGKKS